MIVTLAFILAALLIVIAGSLFDAHAEYDDRADKR